jgi:leucyl aminopeptidase
MKIIVKNVDALSIEAEAIVVPIFQGIKKPELALAKIDVAMGKKISELIKDKVISGKKSEVVAIYSLGKLKADVVVVAGLGKKADFEYNNMRNCAGNVVRKLVQLKCKKAVLVDNLEIPLKFGRDSLYQAFAEGLVLGCYKYTKLKTAKKQKDFEVKDVVMAGNGLKKVEEIQLKVEKGVILGESTNVARDLANTPANLLTPTKFVEFAKEKFKGVKEIELEIIDKKKAQEMGMGAFLGVAQGSEELPFMLVLRHMPKKKEKASWLVGKGVTFDSGGISIKPSRGMGDMKADMSGAAVVLGSMIAVSQLKPEKNVCAIMPLTENMPSGTAQRPGDVVTAMNGKTIEVINTDAEGRLILADALCYAVKEGAKEVVDIATLTGACIVALGNTAAGILGNRQKNINRLIEVGKFTGDWLWQFPLYEDYIDYLKSDVADIMNCTEKGMAGTATAAKFLEQFVKDTPWIHLDIAGVDGYQGNSGYTVKGMSGNGVRNLVEYLLG